MTPAIPVVWCTCAVITGGQRVPQPTCPVHRRPKA